MNFVFASVTGGPIDPTTVRRYQLKPLCEKFRHQQERSEGFSSFGDHNGPGRNGLGRHPEGSGGTTGACAGFGGHYAALYTRCSRG